MGTISNLACAMILPLALKRERQMHVVTKPVHLGRAGNVDSQASSALALNSQTELFTLLKLRQTGTQEHVTRWCEGFGLTKV